jgi:1-deoxy-D-xylulose-5-phosphate synthase
MEDHVVTGGLGTAVSDALQDAGLLHPVERIGWPDAFIDHGSSVAKLREDYGLSAERILEKVLARYARITREGRDATQSVAEKR